LLAVATESRDDFEDLVVANEGILSIFMGLLKIGDEVIVMEPFFDQYISNIEMAGGKCVYFPLQPPSEGDETTPGAGEWNINIADLESVITCKTRMIVVNNPHNPTGKVFTQQELLEIGQLCVDHEILIVSDEVYDKVCYSTFTRIAAISPQIQAQTLTVGSGGKSFGCTGWRVGWVIGPSYLTRLVLEAHTRICLSSVSPLQEALAIAFELANDLDFWSQNRKSMLSKVDRFVEVLEELKIPYSKPAGGVFVLANLAKIKLPDDYPWPEDLSQRPRDFKMAWFLIMELGVAAIPPTAFTTDEKTALLEDWLRFAICKDDAILEEAKARLRRLKNYM
jgi:kynurenine aminotransferase